MSFTFPPQIEIATYAILISFLSLFIWLYLFLGRGGFWLSNQRLPSPEPLSHHYPSVVAVIPARNERETIVACLQSLLAQNYPNSFHIILVDDHSTDGTREAAESLKNTPEGKRLHIIPARSLPMGWTGKMWAVSEGIRHSLSIAPGNRYYLLTDADISHAPQVLQTLVHKAERDNIDLVSLMAMLNHRGFWAQLLIPAFIFFFQKLYPFSWVNCPKLKTAAAAGGCILVRRSALDAAGGISQIHDALIDDCALANAIKSRPGTIHLALTKDVHSLRPYESLQNIWSMVARTAFTQLRHSTPLLILTLIGMFFTYLAAPLTLLTWPLHNSLLAAKLAGAAWFMMTVAFLPTLRLYRLSFGLAFLLPLAGALYGAMTFDSALQHWFGRGGAWKGRTHSPM
ncbi:Glycosyltransferase [Azospirillaceae bacterium]